MAKIGRQARQEKEAGTREERAQVWSERARRWRESGQTQEAYCAAQGLSVWMLRKWIVDLGAAGRKPGHIARLLPIALDRGSAGFQSGMQSSVAGLVPAAREFEGGLEIALPNGARIRAAGASARELTRAIARVLRC